MITYYNDLGRVLIETSQDFKSEYKFDRDFTTVLVSTIGRNVTFSSNLLNALQRSNLISGRGLSYERLQYELYHLSGLFLEQFIKNAEGIMTKSIKRSLVYNFYHLSDYYNSPDSIKMVNELEDEGKKIVFHLWYHFSKAFNFDSEIFRSINNYPILCFKDRGLSRGGNIFSLVKTLNKETYKKLTDVSLRLNYGKEPEKLFKKFICSFIDCGKYDISARDLLPTYVLSPGMTSRDWFNETDLNEINNNVFGTFGEPFL